MEKEKNILRESALDFAIKVSEVCENIVGFDNEIDQLRRASSSIAANLHEARYAQSNADFINKLEVSLKECSESLFWLKFLYQRKKLDEDTFKKLKNECGRIQYKLISSVKTVKQRYNIK